MDSLQIDSSRLLGPTPNSARQKKFLSKFGVTIRYVVAVPFLALGAALMTIGALLAGSSHAHRVSSGRIGRASRVPRF
jgi:hypothetical protein